MRYIFRKPRIFERVVVEPTDICNLKCPSCKRSEGGSTLTPHSFDHILHKLVQAKTKKISFLWRGEPTTSLYLPDLIEKAKRNGFWTYTSTNTSTKNLHNKKYVEKLLHNLDRIEICVDGYNQETIKKYRVGSEWDAIIKNLETISKIPTSCEKRLRVLMFKHNEPYEDTFMGLASKYGMDTISFAAPILPHKILNENEVEGLLPKNSQYQRYIYHGSKWVYRDRERCRLEPRIIITVNGDVAPCCYDWEVDYPLGNIYEDDLLQIESNYRKLWPQMNRKALSICDECFLSTLGFKVNYIKNINVYAPQLYKNYMR
jgi:radical SAM protein with 4Fe4S-binding SPASM domain